MDNPGDNLQWTPRLRQRKRGNLGTFPRLCVIAVQSILSRIFRRPASSVVPHLPFRIFPVRIPQTIDTSHVDGCLEKYFVSGA